MAATGQAHREGLAPARRPAGDGDHRHAARAQALQRRQGRRLDGAVAGERVVDVGEHAAQRPQRGSGQRLQRLHAVDGHRASLAQAALRRRALDRAQEAGPRAFHNGGFTRLRRTPMAKDTTTPPRRKPAAPSRPRHASARAAAKGVRPAQAGDMAPRLGAAGHRAARGAPGHARASRMRRVRRCATLLRRARTAGAGETHATRCRPSSPAPRPTTWRRCATRCSRARRPTAPAPRGPGHGAGAQLARRRLPLQEPDVAQELREAEVPAAGRAAEAAGLGQGDRPARA